MSKQWRKGLDWAANMMGVQFGRNKRVYIASGKYIEVTKRV